MLQDLTIGHVWPNLFREKKHALEKYQILLCSYCNSKAGSSGDAQMQLAEKHKNAERAGLLEDRKIQLVASDNQKPIKLQANVTRTDKTGARLVFSAKRNSPTEIEAFKKMAASKQKFNLIVQPPRLVNTEKAKAGWVTSAFLFAFYTLGYRYLANEYMNPVRQFIWDSFDKKTVAMPDSVSVGEYKNKEVNFDEPRLEINIPLNPPDPCHVEIKMARYVISLPFRFYPAAMVPFLELVVPQIFVSDGLLRKDFDHDTFLTINIQCTKTVPHECVWDFILGKEVPKQGASPENP